MNFLKLKTNFILCNFLVQTLQYFKRNLSLFFCPQKVEKNTIIIAQKNSNPLFFPYCLSCPNDPNRRFFVPKCGLQTNCIKNWDSNLSINTWTRIVPFSIFIIPLFVDKYLQYCIAGNCYYFLFMAKLCRHDQMYNLP